MGEKNKNKKKKCSEDLCEFLVKYMGQEITIHTKSGDTITGILESISKSGIVTIREDGMLSPFMGERLTFIRVEDIESFSVEGHLTEPESS